MRSSRLYLNVPNKEKDQAKSLGARWDPERNELYIDDSNIYHLFRKWYYNQEANGILYNYIYIATANRTCFRCKKQTQVIALVSPNSTYIDENKEIIHENNLEFFRYIDYLPEKFSKFLKEKYNFYYGYSKFIDSYYYGNHCIHCGVLQGDNYLYDEVDSVFFINSIQRAKNITLLKFILPEAIHINFESINSSLIMINSPQANNSLLLKYSKIINIDDDNDEHTYNEVYINPNEIPLVSRPLYDQMFLKNAKKVSSRNRYRNPNSKRVMMVLVIFIVTLNVLYRLPNNSLNILYNIPNNFRNAFASIIENIIDKSPGVLNHSQANDQITPQPIMTFKVGSHPGARGTFILIKDGKRYFTSKIYTEGSIIEFYEDKKIIINDVKADIEEFIAENDVIELEIGNTYTKIYLDGEEYKFVKNFKFDFVNKRIVNIGK